MLVKILTPKILQKQKSSVFEHRSISLLIKLQTFLQYLRQSFLNIVRITENVCLK